MRIRRYHHQWSIVSVWEVQDIIPNKKFSRSPFSTYSYTRRRWFFRMQHPFSFTRFLCFTAATRTISFRKSSRLCWDFVCSCFTATSQSFGKVPCHEHNLGVTSDCLKYRFINIVSIQASFVTVACCDWQRWARSRLIMLECWQWALSMCTTTITTHTVAKCCATAKLQFDVSCVSIFRCQGNQAA